MFNDQLLYKCNFKNVRTVLHQLPLRCCLWFLIVLDCSLAYSFVCLFVCSKEFLFLLLPLYTSYACRGIKKRPRQVDLR